MRKYCILTSLLFYVTIELISETPVSATSNKFLKTEINSSIKNPRKKNKNDSVTKTADEPKKVYYTTKISNNTPHIDGNLNDACWNEGSWEGGFIQRRPAEKEKPSQLTKFKILYDDKNIYVAIKAYESDPSKISRRGASRDGFDGDMVGLSFDSYHDNRTGFEFDVNASGGKTDLILTNSSEDLNWNAVWFGRAGMIDSGWVVEMQIPFSQLRYNNNKEEQVWGLHVWRWIARFQEEDNWNLIPLDGAGIVFNFGEMKGLANLKKSRRIELMPYTVGKLNTYHKEVCNPYSKGQNSDLSLGMDTKIGISSDFTLDLTVNPDFGQIESDPSVMNLSNFETYFEEKRPFFLEGKNILDFNFDGDNLFYSRRIGHNPSYSPDLDSGSYMKTPTNTRILSAEKLTGKTSNGLALGFLHTLTREEDANITNTLNSRNNEYSQPVEPRTNYFLGRLQKDYNQGNTTVGAVFTLVDRNIRDSSLNFLSKNSSTTGLEFLQYFDKKTYYFSAKAVGSYIFGDPESIKRIQESSAHYYQRPDLDYLSIEPDNSDLIGYGLNLGIGKGSKGKWRYSQNISIRSRGLDLNDIGFMRMADMIKHSTSVSYIISQPNGIFRNYSFDTYQSNRWDYDGKRLGSGISTGFYAEFINNWVLYSRANYNGQGLDTRVLRGGPALKVPSNWSSSMYLRSDYSKRFFIDMGTYYGKSDMNISQSFGINQGFSYKVMSSLNFGANLGYNTNRNNDQYIKTTDDNDAPRYILAQLNQQTLGITLRIDYNLSPEFSIAYYSSPYTSIGNYQNFKRVDDATSIDYNMRFKEYSDNEIVNSENTYLIKEDNYPDSPISFENPNFNFNQFRSNLVARWEYRPGSNVYFVWAQDRTESTSTETSTLGSGVSQISKIFPGNIFMIKINYWFSM